MLTSILMTLVLLSIFKLRQLVYDKLISQYRSVDDGNNNFKPISKLLRFEQVIIFIIMFFMIAGIVLFEKLYKEPEPIDSIFWYIMISVVGLSGVYSGYLMHMEHYFFFIWGEDHVEYNFNVDNRPSQYVKLALNEISNIEKTADRYIITAENSKPFKIKIKYLEIFTGSDILKRKLDSLGGIISEEVI